MNRVLNILSVIGGAASIGIGFALLRLVENPQGLMLTLPYILVGVGCGVFGHGMGNVISRKAMKNHPEIEKQQEIERRDERNVAIVSRAKSKAYDMMIFVFGALMLSFALMNVELRVILMLVLSYLFVVGYGIYYRVKYDKEM